MDEETRLDQVAFDSDGLVPAVVQDAEDGAVLMVAWMNKEALDLTLETGQVHFWSRSRQCLWHKGATSGTFMNVVDVTIDCDGDTLLVRVDPEGPACHTGERSCFHRRLRSDVLRNGQGDGGSLFEQRGNSPLASARISDSSRVVDDLFAVILDRQRRRPLGSYTGQLLDAGEDAVLRKIGEEAMEVTLAAKGEGDRRVVSEVADLVYHLLVLLASRGLDPADVASELTRRRGISSA